MAANPSRPGYRFRPTDAELLNHFLRSKINGDVEAVREIPELDDICKFEPWELPDQSPIGTTNNKWFFFYPIIPMDRKRKTGDRLKRLTKEGFWKSSGTDERIKSTDGTEIGTRKTLVFYTGRRSRKQKTDWRMYEYRSVPEQGTLLLCKLIKKADKKLDGRQDEKNIVETNVSSSAIAEDMQSEPVTPVMNAQAEKIASTSASCLPQNSDARTVEDHSYTADGAGDKINIQPDTELEGLLGQMLDTEAEAGCPEVLEGIDEQEFENLLKPYFCDSGTNLAVESEAPNFESHAEVGQQQNNERAPVLAEDMQSEPVTPMMNAQAEKIASTSASCLPKNSDVRTLEDHSRTADSAGDKINILPDPKLGVLGQMLDMEAEVGSSYNYPVANNMDPHHEVQEGTDDEDFLQVLNSFFCDSGMNSAVESEAPNSESYAEGGQEQFETDVEGYGQFNQNNERAPARMEMPVGANRSNDITTEGHFSGQHSVAVASTSNQPCDLFNSPLESSCFGNVNGNSDISATGIRVRTRQSRSLPSGRCSGLQGTAPRRIRLQMDLQELRFEDENHGAKPVTAKAEEAEENYSMPVGDEKETLPVSLKAISALHWFRYILRVLVIVGFSRVFVGTLRR